MDDQITQEDIYYRVCKLFSYISQTLIECRVFARFFAKYWTHEKERHFVNNIGHLFALGLNYFSHHRRQDTLSTSRKNS